MYRIRALRIPENRGCPLFPSLPFTQSVIVRSAVLGDPGHGRTAFGPTPSAHLSTVCLDCKKVTGRLPQKIECVSKPHNTR